MRLDEYNELIQYIGQHPCKCLRKVLSDVVFKYSERFPYHTLLSVFLTKVQRHVKFTYHAKTKPENVKLYYGLYQERIQAISAKIDNGDAVLTCETSGGTSSNKLCDHDERKRTPHSQPVLIELANEFELPPYLMARLIAEQHIKCTDVRTTDKLKHDETIGVKNSNLPQFGQDSKIANSLLRKDGKQEFINNSHLTSTENKLKTGQNENLQQASLYVNEGPVHPVQKRRVQLCSNPETESIAGSSVVTKDVKKIPAVVKTQTTQTSVKNKLSSWMKDPNLITDVVLQEQVMQCMSYDVCYGPINDAIRHSIGLEYEEKLVQNVKKINLAFLDENDLRKRGYDKTPDVKLEVPITVDGHPVCWIESKASFGDLETHSEYLRDQYYSYWNRFGPGLVIYWFGFIDEIAEGMLKQGILVMDGFPTRERIMFMDL